MPGFYLDATGKKSISFITSSGDRTHNRRITVTPLCPCVTTVSIKKIANMKNLCLFCHYDGNTGQILSLVDRWSRTYNALKNSVESGERSVLILCSLLCCVWDTSWRRFFINIGLNKVIDTLVPKGYWQYKRRLGVLRSS